VKKSSITANRKSYTGFPMSHQVHQPWFYAAPNILKMGIKYLNLSYFGQFAAKFHCIKTVSSKAVAKSIAFRVVSIYWQGVAPFPWYLNAKGPTPIGSTWQHAVLSSDAGLLVVTLDWHYQHCDRW